MGEQKTINKYTHKPKAYVSGEPSINDLDPRRCVTLPLSLAPCGRSPVKISLPEAGSNQNWLRERAFTIKKDFPFRVTVELRVQQKVLGGLYYQHVVGARVFVSPPQV
jgi:hypothetical protein